MEVWDFDEGGEQLGVAAALLVALVAVAALCAARFGRQRWQCPWHGRRRTDSISELEERTPLHQSEVQDSLNAIRADMAQSGIRLGGELEYRLAQRRVGSQQSRDPRTARTR